MTRHPSVEFRVGASPTPHFALMLALLYQSLQRHAGLDRFDMTVIVSAGPDQQAETAAFAEWLAPEIRCHPVDPAMFKDHGVHGAADLRLQLPCTADVMVCIDADMIACGDLSELLGDCVAQSTVAGVVAHIAPITRQDWGNLHAAAQLDPPTFPYRYTGWPYMWKKEDRTPGAMMAPPYFNYGFVVIPEAARQSIAEHHRACANAARQAFPSSVFRSQISLTLAIAHSGVRHRALGMKYNFPNDVALEALHPKELADARLLHLLRRNHMFDKREIFASLETLKDFAGTGWETAGSLEIARGIIADILPELEQRARPGQLAHPSWSWTS
ncbi:hypothetical protein K3727_21710 (plasmid) [Rhodobacteraceae bacterium M382]|nr:hypothetical protein K3727_21710 [Rhodobacteraceae bacterium M382]